MRLETDSFLYFFLACKWRFKFMSKEKLENYQLKKAQAIVNFAYNNSKYFHTHFDGYNLKDVWSLPITNKKIMMDNLSDYNTVGLSKQDMINFCLEIEKTQNYDRRFYGFNLAMSSGTSGNKGIVITSPQEEKYLQAALFARFPLPRVLKIKWAFILRVSTPAFNVSKFGQRLTYISQLNTLENIKKQLEDLNPNILSAPPSMLQILAKEVNASRLNIKPKRIVSYAEVLSQDVKNEIEQTFGVKVHQIYQGSEGPIAMSCKYASLHINEDLIYVQTIGFDGQPTAPGEPCYKIILTDLNKRSQPIIRFELDDSILISDSPCKCGSSFRVIEKILGRTDDLFWAQRSDSNELQCIFPDYIRRAIITSSDEIEEYQAIQKDYKKILIRIYLKTENVPKEQIINSISRNIKKVFASYKCTEPDLKIVFERPVRNPRSNKLIRIIRDFEIDEV
ncbi:MAG: F390 synthetase-related protein [Promethearchaeota archaeon]